MTVESMVLVASVLAIFAFGVLLGYRLSKGRVAARARRQEKAQRFLYRQLHELQAARRKDYPARRIDVRSFS
jgi:hypothetical protein